MDRLRHRTLAPALRKAATLPQAENRGEQENPLIERFLRVKPCPIKRLRSLAPAAHQAQQREAGRDR